MEKMEHQEPIRSDDLKNGLRILAHMMVKHHFRVQQSKKMAENASDNNNRSGKAHVTML